MIWMILWHFVFWDAGLVYGVYQIGAIPITRPGPLDIFTHEEISSSLTRFSVLVATLDVTADSGDPAYILLHPGIDVGNNFTQVQPTPLYNLFHWPKDIAQVPSSVFGVPSIVIPDGTNLTGKTLGAIYVTDVTDFNFPSTVDISTGEVQEPWGYGKILWKTIDGDDRLDILTCRWQVESGILKYSQLVWLNQPLLNPMTRAWNVNILKESACDLNLALMTIQDSSNNLWDIVYTTGFRTRKLSFFWTENSLGNPGNWDDPTQVMGDVLESGREYLDVFVTDLNNDGINEVLVVVIANQNGSLEVFIPPPPDDFRNPAAYSKIVIASNFSSRYGGELGRAPGVVRVFHPTISQVTKPWILLAGGDDGRGYYLVPSSEHPGDWTYELITIMDKGPDQWISGAAVVDIDGDGYTEAFFSVQTSNVVDVFTLRNTND